MFFFVFLDKSQFQGYHFVKKARQAEAFIKTNSFCLSIVVQQVKIFKKRNHLLCFNIVAPEE
jgi:hypothetical protein